MSKSCRILIFVLVWLLAIVSWPAPNAARRNRYKMLWHSFDCIIGPEDMEKVSIDIEYSEPVKEMWCRYKLSVPRPIQKTEFVLFDSTFDVCQFLSTGVLQNKLALFVYQNMVKDSNLGKKCPFNQGPLYFHNISALDSFPAFLPETDFTLIMIFFMPNTTNSVESTLKGSIVESNRARKKKLTLS